MAAFRFTLISSCKQSMYRNSYFIESSNCAIKAVAAANVNIPRQTTFLPIVTSLRLSHTFLSRLTAEQLWKGVTSVSNAGRKKGRGRASGRTKQRDLNRGQVIGFGTKNMLWPGLNAPVIQGKEVLKQTELPPDEERQKRIFELRDKSINTRRTFKIHPLDRGWTGNRLPGRSLGPPDPIGEETFEGFDSRVLEFKPVVHMTGARGRVRQMSAVVIVGNKKGLAGFAKATSVNGNSAAKHAKNKAAKRLRYIELDNNSVRHDFVSQFGAVKVFVHKRPEGHGLVCHRVIRSICEVLGIKDLWAKVEGPTTNYQCVIKAFFIGLHNQKSPQQLASEKGLHIVEMRRNRDYYPVVIASPEHCRTEEELGPTELLDYKVHLLNGKVEVPIEKYKPFYINFPSYIKEMKDRERLRNQKGVRIHLLAKYGALKSFINVREEEKAKKELKETVEE